MPFRVRMNSILSASRYIIVVIYFPGTNTNPECEAKEKTIVFADVDDTIKAGHNDKVAHAIKKGIF